MTGDAPVETHELFADAEGVGVQDGVADVVCGTEELQLRRGEHIHISLQTNHRLGNSGDGPLEIIEVQLGDYLGEDDIVRLEDDYRRIE